MEILNKKSCYKTLAQNLIETARAIVRNKKLSHETSADLRRKHQYNLERLKDFKGVYLFQEKAGDMEMEGKYDDFLIYEYMEREGYSFKGEI